MFNGWGKIQAFSMKSLWLECGDEAQFAEKGGLVLDRHTVGCHNSSLSLEKRQTLGML